MGVRSCDRKAILCDISDCIFSTLRARVILVGSGRS